MSDTITYSSGTTNTDTINISSGQSETIPAGAFVSDSGSVSNDGTLTVAGRLSDSGDYTGSGNIIVENGGRVGFGGTASNTGYILFSGNSDVLDEDTPQTFTPVLSGLELGDRLALSPIGLTSAFATVTPTSAGYESVSYTGTNGGGTETFTFNVATASLPVGAQFMAETSVANNGLGIDLLVTCFLAGTRIATPGGERAVETLAIGDSVTTADGATKPVKWIGRRSFAGRFLTSNPNAQPVLVRAGALAEGVPARDLFISRCHSLAIDGVLIPAGELVNGVTILPCTGLDEVEYYHVELEGHDLILAEGAAVETFLDDDSRAAFHNASEYEALYPGPQAEQGFCMPRRRSGYEVEAVRRRLAGRAGQLAAA